MDVPRGATINGGTLELVVVDPNTVKPVRPGQLKQLAEHIARQQQGDASVGKVMRASA